MEIKTHLSSLEQTHALGAALADLCAAHAFLSAENTHSAVAAGKGLFVGLTGPLGAGKTELARAILTRLGVRGEITSPTFVFECQYEDPWLPLKVVHSDLYRWTHESVPQDFFDYRREPRTLLLVEWPERSQDLLNLLDIRIMLAFRDAAPERSSDSVSAPPREMPETEVQREVQIEFAAGFALWQRQRLSHGQGLDEFRSALAKAGIVVTTGK